MSRRLSSLLIAIAVAFLATVSWSRTGSAATDAVLRVTRAVAAKAPSDRSEPPAFALVDVEDESEDDDDAGEDADDLPDVSSEHEPERPSGRGAALGRGREAPLRGDGRSTSRTARGPPSVAV